MVGAIAKPASMTVYEHDFYAWTQQQAAALRAAVRTGANLPVDWENVAEEIESLGRSDARELRSRIATIVEHLLKLEFAPTDLPRAGWEETVDRSREAFEKLIAESPSLRPGVVAWVENEHRGSVRQVLRALSRQGELDGALAARIEARRYNQDEVLGEWWPAPDRQGMGTD